jgi:peptidoglycan/LPS O-acetylase OafA/YrhL
MEDAPLTLSNQIVDQTGTKTRDTKVFHTMNGMRGVAAVAVMIRHATLYFGFGLSSSYLAVDLFFVLSGFVLAHAYEARFERGMGVGNFMRARFIRFYPLFALGIAITLVGVVVGWMSGVHLSWTPLSLAWCAAFNLSFLPAYLRPGMPVFPLDIPGWSLFFELLVNLLYVLTWRLLSNRVLIALLGVGTVALAASAAIFGDLGGGVDWPNFVVGLVRVLFGFPAGVLIYRLTRNWRPIRLNALFVIAAMLVLLAIDPKGARAAYDLAAVVVGFPIIVILASLTRPTRLVGTFTFLGTTSYAVYAIHHPVINLLNGTVIKLMGRTPEHFAPWLGLAFMAVMLTAAWLLDKYYDEPVRRWLSTTPLFRARTAPATSGVKIKVQASPKRSWWWGLEND